MPYRRKRRNTRKKDYQLKKEFGVYKEAKVNLTRIETKSTLTKTTEKYHKVELSVTEMTVKNNSLQKGQWSTETVVKTSEPNEGTSNNTFKILKDVKVVLSRLNISSLTELQTVICAPNIPETADKKKLITLPEEDVQYMWDNKPENFDYVTVDSSVKSESFFLYDPTDYVNPMDIDESIRDERILRIKQLLQEREKEVEAYRRKLYL